MAEVLDADDLPTEIVTDAGIVNRRVGGCRLGRRSDSSGRLFATCERQIAIFR
jgi:hypothetical protein